MSSLLDESLRVAIMVSDRGFLSSAVLFNWRYFRGFSVVGYVSVIEILFDPLPPGYVQYFEYQKCCAFSLDYLVWIRRRVAKGGQGSLTPRARLRRRLVELVMPKMD